MSSFGLLPVIDYAALTWTFTAAAIVTTTVRLGIRAFVLKSIGLDDYLILFGQVRKQCVYLCRHLQDCILTIENVVRRLPQ